MSECMIPAAGSRNSVRISTPARWSRRRRGKFVRVVARSSGWPRCQFRTRTAHSQPNARARTTISM